MTAEPDLVSRARSGDRRALDQLLRDEYDRIATLSRRLLGNRTDAEDATQLALLAIVRGLPRFDGRSSFSTWAYRVTTNVCLDELRRRSRRPLPTSDEQLASTLSGFEHRLMGASSAEDGLGSFEHQATLRHDIDAALATLRPEFRVAVVLRDLCGFDYAEIAELTDTAPGTVRSRISRGREALAAHLGDDEHPAPGGSATPGNQTSDANVQPVDEGSP